MYSGQWKAGYLDYSLIEGAVRIKVHSWRKVIPVTGQYFERSLNWRMPLDYVREVGLRTVVSKIVSRLSERGRNRKYVSVGMGSVLESSVESVAAGEWVLFVAPNHPAAVDRLVIHEDLVRVIDDDRCAHDGSRRFIIGATDTIDAVSDAANEVAGWEPWSGAMLPRHAVDTLLAFAKGHAFMPGHEVTEIAPPVDDGPVSERSKLTPHKAAVDKPGIAVFGFGNYVKTITLPALSRWFEVQAIHELDPLQIDRQPDSSKCWDTSPRLRPDERYDAIVVAGFHHHHAHIAIQALRNNAYVLVEKPIATTIGQVDELSATLRASGQSRLVAGFQRRFLPCNRSLRDDLGLGQSDPFACYAIVYEVPLPMRHWYRWPNSRSRILSNACHWLDHFMYLNDFVSVRGADTRRLSNGDFLISTELSNGSTFVLILTEKGSPRLGLRDHVEFRSGYGTAQLQDGRRYMAESKSRIVRRQTWTRVEPYKLMYEDFARRVINREMGDSVDTLASSELAARLDEQIVSCYPNVLATFMEPKGNGGGVN